MLHFPTYLRFDENSDDNVSETISFLQEKKQWGRSMPLVLDGIRWSENPSNEDKAVSVLNALRENDRIQSLTIQNSFLGFKTRYALKEVLNHNTTLQSISIRNVKGHDNQALTIPMSIFKNDKIQALTLENCVIDKCGEQAFAQMLRNPHSSLSRLSLNRVRFCGDEFLTTLATALSINRSLECVTIRSTSHHGGTIAITNLLQGFERNTSIKILKLDDMCLDCHHSEQIASMLRHNRSIELMSLKGNNLNGAAISKIMMSGLTYNATVKNLNLSHNPIGSDGVENIVSCLKQNHTIQHLSLINCEIWYDGCQKLARALSSFCGLSELMMDGNEMERCGAELLESVRVNTTIKKILRMAPNQSLRNDGRIDDAIIWDTVDMYLSLNNANRHEMNSIVYSCPPGYIAAFLGRSRVTKNPDVLYHFLKSNLQCSNNY